MKILFIPMSVTAGFVSGQVAKKLFEAAWGLVDDEDAPKPEQRWAPFAKVVVAAALEGAIAKGTRAALDHKARQAFSNATGTWPGEAEPKDE